MTGKEDILSALRLEIKFIRRDSVWNHLLTVIRIDDDAYSGQITSEEFKIWRYSSWSGIFYPVIYGIFETSNGGVNLKLKSKLNPIGLSLVFIITAGFGYGILEGVILQADNSVEFLWKRIAMGLLVLSFPLTALYLICNTQKKKELERIKNVIQQRLSAIQ